MVDERPKDGDAAAGDAVDDVPTHNLPPEVEEQVRQAFKLFDVSGDGSIDADELKAVLDAVTGRNMAIEEVQEMINQVDAGGDGQIQEPEFLKLISDQVNAGQREEEIVELFKDFGPTNINEVITVGKLDETLKKGGENLKDHELNMIFEELAGQTKRQSQKAEKRFDRTQGITFHDFLLLMLPK